MKDIPGFENYYKATLCGRIYSVRNKKFLSLTLKRNGYVYCQLNVKGKAKHYRAHRLIALTYLENKENKEFVNHKNGIKSDNRVDNLEWVTPSENNKHALNTGLSYVKSTFWDLYKDNQYIGTFYGHKSLRQKLNCSKNTVYNIINHKYKSDFIIQRSTTIPNGSRTKQSEAGSISNWNGDIV